MSPAPRRGGPDGDGRRAVRLAVTACTATSALGRGLDAQFRAIEACRSGLRPNDFTSARLDTWIGRVEGLEDAALPGEFSGWDCRNNRLAWAALQQDGFREAAARARAAYGARRVALLLGTSTSSIGATEDAYRRRSPDGALPPGTTASIVHTAHSLGDFVGRALGLEGVSATVVTACSSGAKVLAQAERLIRTGLADAAVVGGVDTLCDSVLFGFNALELASPEPCRPFDAQRRGISIGEAGGFALLEREGPGVRLLGWGESSDAHHMSSPHPSGLGARMAIEAALARAEIPAADIGYINLHGTGTLHNDEVEARVVAALFPPGTHASSTKGWTGHALGAAGFLEAALSILAITRGLAPGNLNARELDPACGPQLQLENAPLQRPVAMSLSFGFGGSNCALVFGAEGAA